MSVIQILLVGIATAGVEAMSQGDGTYKVYVGVGCPSLLFVDTHPWVGFFYPSFFLYTYIYIYVLYLHKVILVEIQL